MEDQRFQLDLFMAQYRDRLGKRYATLFEALAWVHGEPDVVIVETGCLRTRDNWAGDGQSTLVFAEYAYHHASTLTSIDIDPTACNVAESLLAETEIGQVVKIICNDSVAELSRIGLGIDLLYLDSFDYDARNPEPSQLHHLKEAQTVLPSMNSKSAILIDDCDLPGGGKGGLAIAHLCQVGGYKIAKSEYQTLLIR